MLSFLFYFYKQIARAFQGHGIGRFFPLLGILDDLIMSRLRPDSVCVQGFTFYLDHTDSCRLSIRGVHEPFETAFVKKLVKKGDTALDIGANIGYYTVLLASMVGTEGRVFSFEPDPANFSLLQKNAKVNGCTNTILVRKAVSNEMGRRRLHLSSADPGDHRLHFPVGNRRSIDVDCTSLDVFLQTVQ